MNKTMTAKEVIGNPEDLTEITGRTTDAELNAMTTRAVNELAEQNITVDHAELLEAVTELRNQRLIQAMSGALYQEHNRLRGNY